MTTHALLTFIDSNSKPISTIWIRRDGYPSWMQQFFKRAASMHALQNCNMEISDFSCALIAAISTEAYSKELEYYRRADSANAETTRKFADLAGPGGDVRLLGCAPNNFRDNYPVHWIYEVSDHDNTLRLDAWHAEDNRHVIRNVSVESFIIEAEAEVKALDNSKAVLV